MVGGDNMTLPSADTVAIEYLRESLNLDPKDESFDSEIAAHANAAIDKLRQAGVGLGETAYLTPTATFGEIFVDPEGKVSEKLVMLASSYLFLEVKMLFDPPATNTQNIMKQSSDEAIWRLRVAWDEQYESPEGGDSIVGRETIVDDIFGTRTLRS